MKPFTEELGRAIIRAIGTGAPYHIVAEAYGMRESSLHTWLDQGIADAENGNPTEIAKFAVQLRRNELRLIKNSLIKIRKYPKLWKNHAWTLEHVFPRYYGSNVMELERLSRELQTLTTYVQTLTQNPALQKPVVKVIEDDVKCLNDSQGADDHG